MNGTRIITLTTDFGSRDAYVACMKGVILGIAPHATLIDISHEVPHQSIGQGAFLLETAWRYFPDDAIHLAVVDPGVGTVRRPIAVQLPHGTYVGPDNGLFTPILLEQEAIDQKTGKLLHGTAVELEAAEYRRSQVSNTFHGRDIFAPAAGHLAAGVSITAFGRELSELVLGETAQAELVDGAMRGTIQHVDTFGNLITNIRADVLPAPPEIVAGDLTISGLSTNYQERQVSALIGSSGYLEIAERDGSAAGLLGLGVGDEVWVRAR